MHNDDEYIEEIKQRLRKALKDAGLDSEIVELEANVDAKVSAQERLDAIVADVATGDPAMIIGHMMVGRNKLIEAAAAFIAVTIPLQAVHCCVAEDADETTKIMVAAIKDLLINIEANRRYFSIGNEIDWSELSPWTKTYTYESQVVMVEERLANHTD